MISHAEMERNLLARYDSVPRRKRPEYLAWYAVERATARAIARQYGITVRQAAAIMACYSQNNTWKGNLTDTHTFLSNPTRPHGLALAYGPAKRILNGERPLDVLAADGVKYPQKSGKLIGFARDPFKLRAFYRNLAGDDAALTMDRWAARAADPAQGNPGNERDYNLLADAYRAAAKRRRQPPASFQAIVWCAIRGTGE